MGKTKAVQLDDRWHSVLSKYVASENTKGGPKTQITTTVERALANYTPLQKFAIQENLI